MEHTDEKPVILVVDDEEIIRFMVKKILREYGQIVEAEDGQTALCLLETHKADIVLLDYLLPDIDGIEVLKRMKRRPEMENVPVVILTSDVSIDLETEVFRSGAADFIRKPFVPPAMQERVLRILQNEKFRRSLQAEVSKQTRLAEEQLAVSLRLFDQMVLALAEAIDAKDTYTKGHSRRVAEYARMMAMRLGASTEQQRNIYCMGILHDVGKIGVPVGIINKPSSLTDEEAKIIKSHTTIGANILNQITEFPMLAIGAHYHHERWDGKGYPEGLKGEEIPEEARIIAVADAYDAMTSKRSYRDVMTKQRVYQEIERGKGTQFDPKFADIMLEMMDEDKNFSMMAELKDTE